MMKIEIFENSDIFTYIQRNCTSCIKNIIGYTEAPTNQGKNY